MMFIFIYGSLITHSGKPALAILPGYQQIKGTQNTPISILDCTYHPERIALIFVSGKY
jgi:hypothetical protein